jgi:hypothetical protein
VKEAALAERSYPAWFIDALARADSQAPGLLRETLTSAQGRQNIIAAALALQNDAVSAEQASLLRHTRTNRVLCLLFPKLPDGYPAIVRHQRRQVQPPAFYHELREFLDRNSDCRQTLKALRESRHLNMESINVLRSLERLARLPKVLQVLPTERDALSLQDQIKLVRLLVPTISDADLRTAINRLIQDLHERVAWVRSGERLADSTTGLLEHIMAEIAFPEPPLEPQANLIPLRNCADMKRAAMRLRNCAADLIANVALGSSFYYIWQPPAREADCAFIELERTGKWWRVTSYRGERNRALDQVVESEMITDLRSAGAIVSESWPPTLLDRFSWFEPLKFQVEWESEVRGAETGDAW